VTYLYVIAAENATKIGISGKPERRLQFLQLETSQILRLVEKFKFGSISEARDIEGRCHRALQAHRLAGSEWFDCAPQECVDLARNFHSSAASHDASADENDGPAEINTDAHRALISILAASRKEAGFTQRGVADLLGKPRSYISKIESGERIPRITEFCDIALALKLNPELLFQRFWRWR
jgi:DNA-binding XRE family transcriptional regulator